MEERTELVDEKHGFFKCEKCGGLGGRYITGQQKLIICPICHGEGYLDWVQKVTGKPSRSMVDLLTKTKRMMELEEIYIKYECKPPSELGEVLVYDEMNREYKIFKRGLWFTIPEEMLVVSNKKLQELFEYFG
jgi:RecJ-like exonuclease